jgi:hypothetical protein
VHPRRLEVSFALVVTLLLVTAVGARASFPGKNGELTFDVYTDTTGTVEDGECATPNCEDQRIYALRVGDRKARRLRTCGARECHDS